MREQVQRLNKTPGTEVQTGVLQSGVTQTPNMPFVQIQKTKGQRLAETFGVVADGVTKLIKQQAEIYGDKKAKQQATIDDIEYTTYANKVARKAIDEIEQLPVEQREQAYIDRLHTDVDNFKNQYKNGAISDTAFKAYVGTISTQYQGFADKSRAIKLGNIAEDAAAKVKEYVADSKFQSYSDIDIETASKAYGVSKTELATYWLDNKIATIQKQYQDGYITPKGAIAELERVHKSMATKDNPNIWKNADYVKSINTAKASMITAQATLDTKTEKKLEDLQKETGNNFKAQLLSAPDQETFNSVLTNALTATIEGKMKWSDYVSVVESSRETKYKIQPSNPITANSYIDLKMAARTDATFGYAELSQLEKAGNLTATQTSEIEGLIKERLVLSRTMNEKGQSESWTRGNKLIASVTKQGLVIDPGMKDKADEMNLEYLDRVTKGEDPYTVARELTTRYFPKIETRIDEKLIEANPKQYMARKYQVTDMNASGFIKAFGALQSKEDKVTFQKDLLKLQQKGDVSIEEYVEFYKIYRKGK